MNYKTYCKSEFNNTYLLGISSDNSKVSEFLNIGHTSMSSFVRFYFDWFGLESIVFCLCFVSTLWVLTYSQLYFHSHSVNISELKGQYHFLAENKSWEDRKKKASSSFTTIIGLQIFQLSLSFGLAKGLERQVRSQTTIFCCHHALQKLFQVLCFHILASCWNGSCYNHLQLLTLLLLCQASYLNFSPQLLACNCMIL